MSGTLGSPMGGMPGAGSQMATALQGTMDSASIARLVQQLMALQSGAQAQPGGTMAPGQPQAAGGQQQPGGTPGDPNNPQNQLTSQDYATMMQQMLALLYGRGQGTGGGGGAEGGPGGGGGNSS